MTRALWFVAGAGVGIYGMVRGRRAAEAFTADGLHDRMGALFLGARMFRDEVAQGAAERETELRERFGVLPHETSHPPALHSTESTQSTQSTHSTESRGQH